MVNKVKGSVAPDSSEVPYTGLESAEVTVEAVLDELLTGIEALPVDPLNTKVIEIGDWNMDTSTQATVTHGLTYANIRTVSATIRNDSDSTMYDFAATINNQNGISTGYIAITSTTIILARDTTGTFDSAVFDATSYNRGWITIQYTE